jgi:hypothetical protein
MQPALLHFRIRARLLEELYEGLQDKTPSFRISLRQCLGNACSARAHDLNSERDRMENCDMLELAE